MTFDEVKLTGKYAVSERFNLIFPLADDYVNQGKNVDYALKDRAGL